MLTTSDDLSWNFKVRSEYQHRMDISRSKCDHRFNRQIGHNSNHAHSHVRTPTGTQIQNKFGSGMRPKMRSGVDRNLMSMVIDNRIQDHSNYKRIICTSLNVNGVDIRLLSNVSVRTSIQRQIKCSNPRPKTGEHWRWSVQMKSTERGWWVYVT